MGTTGLQIPVVVGRHSTTRTAWAIPTAFRPRMTIIGPTVPMTGNAKTRPTGRIRGARTRRPPTPGPPPLGRAHFPTSPPEEITARKFGVYTRSGFDSINGNAVANADD